MPLCKTRKHFMKIAVIKIYFFGFFLLTCSCSKSIVGSYAENSIKDGCHFNKYLELNKDSTFSYKEKNNFAINTANPPDQSFPDRVFIGRGHYSINKKKLVLNFELKFRKIDTIEIVPLSIDGISKIRKHVGDSTRFQSDIVNIVFNMNVDGFYFNNAEADIIPFGCMYLNRQPFWITNIYNRHYRAYFRSQFPLELIFDFGKLIGANDDPYRGLVYPDEINSLGFGFGYLDEKIKIEKAGNYQINIRLKKGLQDKTFTGKREFRIETLSGKIKIGDMTRAPKQTIIYN